MRTWLPLLTVSLLWLLSHSTPWTYESESSANSVWTVYSESGQVGWARVELSGPNPREAYGTTAIDALRAWVEEGRSMWMFSIHSRQNGETQTPGAELDRIDRHEARIGWGLIVVACLLGTCWKVFQRNWRAATRR